MSDHYELYITPLTNNILVSCAQTFDKEGTSGETAIDKVGLCTDLCRPIRSTYTYEYN